MESFKTRIAEMKAFLESQKSQFKKCVETHCVVAVLQASRRRWPRLHREGRFRRWRAIPRDRRRRQAIRRPGRAPRRRLPTSTPPTDRRSRHPRPAPARRTPTCPCSRTSWWSTTIQAVPGRRCRNTGFSIWGTFQKRRHGLRCFHFITARKDGCRPDWTFSRTAHALRTKPHPAVLPTQSSSKVMSSRWFSSKRTL